MDLLNYSPYEYAQELPMFREHDRLSEHDRTSLECSDLYQPEKRLNEFTDELLNDHLYSLYCTQRLKTPTLIRKLVIFFVKRYRNHITDQVQKYLESKKLDLDDWLTAVKDNRRRDILSLYLLNMITGCHSCIHLKDNLMWSALRNPPPKHDDHVNMCDLHLIYLGFGAFICLVPKQVPDYKDFTILGQITAEDPTTLHELNLMALNRQQIQPRPRTSMPSAAAGSIHQLPRVEAEMNHSAT